MRSAFTLGRPFGIDVRLHVSFLVLLAFLVLHPLFVGAGVGAAAFELVFLIGLFGSVVLHELGHALMARRYGIGTRGITLLPIGGVAQLETGQMSPRVELWVALAGPAVNAVLAAAGFALMAAGLDGELVQRLAFANVALGVFNLIPAFPMDGGRVLRALLARKLGNRRATGIASGLGRVFAGLFAAAALVFSKPMLLLVALFVYFAAKVEHRRATMEPRRVVYVRRPPWI